MRICEYVSENNVILGLRSKYKKSVLKEFVSELKERKLIPKEKKILDELLKRESLGSTGLEKGVAIPHALTDEVKEPLVTLALVKEGVEFEAVDKLPTYVLFLILGDKNNPGIQLKILAHICRLVKETDFLERVKKVNNPSKVCKILKEEEEKIV